MFSLTSSHRYYLYPKICDMRKSFAGLTGLVQQTLHKNPLSGDVFIFLNRKRTHVKLLHWEAGGFVLYYKRLEQGTFSMPSTTSSGQVQWTTLVLMVDGLEVKKQVQKKRFRR